MESMLTRNNEERQLIIKYGQLMYELALSQVERPENSYEMAEIMAEKMEIIEV